MKTSGAMVISYLQSFQLYGKVLIATNLLLLIIMEKFLLPLSQDDSHLYFLY